MEEMRVPIVRRELPTQYAPLIISIGAPIRLYDAAGAGFTDVGSFITGAYDRAQLVGSAGLSGGVQVNLTLLAIRRLVGRPLADLANGAAHLGDVLGPVAAECEERIAAASSWSERFALMDGLLADRFGRPFTLAPEVHDAWRQIAGSKGRLPIGDVARHVGWSRKHLIDRFRDEFGLPPKTMARVLRFGEVVNGIKAQRATSLADLALQCGYYDQSHLTRDAREFAGTTPGALAASLLPDGGGFLADTAR
ncbi:MAG: helix-turn-helix domain-containing protein [Vicinamibacterales bacterium]